MKNALSSEELEKAQDAAGRLINTSDEDMPAGLERMGPGAHTPYHRGFAFDRALEHLTMHRKTWGIVKELTGNKPCLCRGNLIVDTHKHPTNAFHVGPGQTIALGHNRDGHNSPREFGEPGTLYCNFFNVFWCLTDVHAGDGGLILAPGSHKSEFESPYEGGSYESAEDLPEGIINITPNAGDAVVMPDHVYHGSMKWQPMDRDRRVMLFRYVTQYELSFQNAHDEVLEDELLDRLAPETRELVQTAWRSHEKEITKYDEIRLI